MKPRVLILRTAGTNCDRESAHAMDLAGAEPHDLHVNRLIESPRAMSDYQILVIPGGFSYGDDIAAGRIFANQIRHHLADAFRAFVEAGKPIIGICNGFQVLVKTDILPGPLAGVSGQTATLAHNTSGRFIDKWVSLNAPESRCIWTQGLGPLELPIAHGEGRFVPATEAVRAALHEQKQVALVYASPAGTAPDAAVGNPNGSTDDIAGVCDATGLVLGLMPHPERYVDPTQHYAWTRSAGLPAEGAGLRLFRNAVRHVTLAAAGPK